MRQTAEKTPKLRLYLPPPIVFVIPFGVGVGLGFVPGVPDLPLLDWVAYTLGGLLIILGFTFISWAFYTLRRGGETPDYKADTLALVTSGPFKVSRNPFYLSLAITGFGIAVALQSITALLSVLIAGVALQIFVISPEERYLVSLFQERYESYRQKTRRWI